MRFYRLSAAAVVAILVGCTNSLESLPVGQQAQSINNPDGVTRAFVWIPTMSGGMGATLSQPYQVWIENAQYSSKLLVVEAEKTNGYRLAWVNSNTLEVCYAQARIFKFRNAADFFAIEQSPDKPIEIKSIEIVLRRMRSLDLC